MRHSSPRRSSTPRRRVQLAALHGAVDRPSGFGPTSQGDRYRATSSSSRAHPRAKRCIARARMSTLCIPRRWPPCTAPEGWPFGDGQWLTGATRTGNGYQTVRDAIQPRRRRARHARVRRGHQAVGSHLRAAQQWRGSADHLRHAAVRDDSRARTMCIARSSRSPSATGSRRTSRRRCAFRVKRLRVAMTSCVGDAGVNIPRWRRGQRHHLRWRGQRSAQW